MNRTKVSTKNHSILSFLLLFSLGQQIRGQKKEARIYFPINDNTAFIDTYIDKAGAYRWQKLAPTR